MNNQIDGHCGYCGAPYNYPTMWHGILPPTPQPSCNCLNIERTYTTTYTFVTNFDDCQHNNGWYEYIYFNFLGIKLKKRIFICKDCEKLVDVKEMENIKLLKNNPESIEFSKKKL